MSHFTTINTRIRDLDALADACRELGVELRGRGTARGYGSSTREGDAVIRLKGPYDIALKRMDEGTYELATDWWGGHVAREAGEKYGRLLQLYGVCKATREARRRGYGVVRRNLADGRIRLEIGGVR